MVCWEAGNKSCALPSYLSICSSRSIETPIFVFWTRRGNQLQAAFPRIKINTTLSSGSYHRTNPTAHVIRLFVRCMGFKETRKRSCKLKLNQIDCLFFYDCSISTTVSFIFIDRRFSLPACSFLSHPVPSFLLPRTTSPTFRFQVSIA